MGVDQSRVDTEDQERQQIVDIIRKQGYEVGQSFDHPTFGRLILADVVRRGKHAKHAYVREYEVNSEEKGMLLYQYLLRQEQQENNAFLRVYTHFIKPVRVDTINCRLAVV